MGNIITIAILLSIVAFDAIYILKKKKSGKSCCGCCKNCSKCLKPVDIGDDSDCETENRVEKSQKVNENCER